ncbi:hypothetical protein [Planktotalea sp.]|uniref:hypothetical protein n=1 Tax=Planktotalea sp. TaxID=2029877 RepID=UPI003D6AB640
MSTDIPQLTPPPPAANKDMDDTTFDAHIDQRHDWEPLRVEEENELVEWQRQKLEQTAEHEQRAKAAKAELEADAAVVEGLKIEVEQDAADVADLHAQVEQAQNDVNSSKYEAALSASLAAESEAITIGAETNVLSALDAQGPYTIVATKAEADALNLNNGDIVEVQADESRDGNRTRYRQEGGSLTLLIDLSATGEALQARNRRIVLHPKYQKLIWTSDWQLDRNAPNGADQEVMQADIHASICENHADADGVFFLGDIADLGEVPAHILSGYTVPHATLADQRALIRNLPGWLQAEIDGNHDFNTRDPAEDFAEGETLAEYERQFPAPTYHLEMGDVVLVFMGDEKKSKQGNISHQTFEWWEEIHQAYQEHKLMITGSHQSLAHTIDYTPDMPGRHIDNSQLFIDAMTRADRPCKPHLWFCGHHGSYQSENLGQRALVAHGGCRFVQVGAHIPSIAGADPARPLVYWTMHLTGGSDQVVLKQWDVGAGGYIDANEITVQAPVPLKLRNHLTFDGRVQKHARFDLQAQVMLASASRLLRVTINQEIRLRQLEGKPTYGTEKIL